MCFINAFVFYFSVDEPTGLIPMHAEDILYGC